MKITKEKFTDITETSFDGNTYEACDFSNLRVDYEVLSKVKFIDCNFSNEVSRAKVIKKSETTNQI